MPTLVFQQHLLEHWKTMFQFYFLQKFCTRRLLSQIEKSQFNFNCKQTTQTRDYEFILFICWWHAEKNIKYFWNFRLKSATMFLPENIFCAHWQKGIKLIHIFNWFMTAALYLSHSLMPIRANNNNINFVTPNTGKFRWIYSFFMLVMIIFSIPTKCNVPGTYWNWNENSSRRRKKENEKWSRVLFFFFINIKFHSTAKAFLIMESYLFSVQLLKVTPC